MEGRKRKVEGVVRERKRNYIENQKGYLLAEDANRNFYKHVKNFSKFERPQQFDVRMLLPGKSDFETAEVLADYFNKVSKEFDPLEPSDIPAAKPASGRQLACLRWQPGYVRCESLNQWYLGTYTRSLLRSSQTS